MKRIHGLMTGLAVGLLFCACGAGDEEASSVGDPVANEDRASEQVEAAQSPGQLDADSQTAEGTPTPAVCLAACTKLSSTNLTGLCCSCDGVNRTWHKSPVLANLYLCM